MKPEDPGTIMVAHAYGVPVVQALCDLPGRKLPRAAMRVYSSLLCEIAPGTGELLCSPMELAERSEIKPDYLEEVMVTLARLGIVVRHPHASERAWFINPHLAWAGSLKARAQFAALVQPPNIEPKPDDDNVSTRRARRAR